MHTQHADVELGKYNRKYVRGLHPSDTITNEPFARFFFALSIYLPISLSIYLFIYVCIYMHI